MDDQRPEQQLPACPNCEAAEAEADHERMTVRSLRHELAMALDAWQRKVRECDELRTALAGSALHAIRSECDEDTVGRVERALGIRPEHGLCDPCAHGQHNRCTFCACQCNDAAGRIAEKPPEERFEDADDLVRCPGCDQDWLAAADHVAGSEECIDNRRKDGL